MPSSWLTSRMSIRPSMDPEEMSWPGNRAPLGWRRLAESASKRVQVQVRKCASTPDVCVRHTCRPPLSAEKKSHNGKYTQGGRRCLRSLAQISPCCPPALFPFPDQDSPRSCVWALCLFSLSLSLLCAFPRLTLPLLPNIRVALWPTSDVPHTHCWGRLTLRLSLMGLCNPPASHLAHTSTNTTSNQLFSAAELFCGLVLLHDPGAPAVATARIYLAQTWSATISNPLHHTRHD
jgi:hypothetical protein